MSNHNVQHRDPHEAAALIALRRRGGSTLSSVPPAASEAASAPGTPLIELAVSNGVMLWRCRADHGSRKANGGSITGVAAVRRSVRRHIAQFHPERDADVEVARAR